jgi:ribose-phosphate pyrophosphokinase
MMNFARSRGDLCLFALDASRDLAESIAGRLGLSLSDHEERNFEDGEHKSRPLVSVRGKDVYVVQSLYGDDMQSPDDKLCRLLFFIGALKDAAAGRITAVVPYLCYARKDRKTQTRDPVTTRYIATLFEAVGTDRIVTMDVHNLAAYQNSFRCGTDHLEAKMLFVEHFRERLEGQNIVVISPDVGGVKRADQFREAVARATGAEIGSAFMEKRRARGIVSGDVVVGDVKDKVGIIIDDLISTGTTIARAVKACRALGARQMYAAATHGLFIGQAGAMLANSGLEKVVVTDTVPPFRLPQDVARDRLVVLETAPLFARAIERMNAGGSIVEVLAG